MTEWVGIASIVVSSLITIALAFLILHLKFLSKRLDSVEETLRNHVETALLQMAKEIGELRGRIKIND